MDSLVALKMGFFIDYPLSMQHVFTGIPNKLIIQQEHLPELSLSIGFNAVIVDTAR
jgi:hypothetical protein